MPFCACFKIRKIKSSLYPRYHAEVCNEWRAHLRSLASGQHSSEETSQRWRAIGDTMSDLTGSGIEPQTSHTDRDMLNIEPTYRLCVYCQFLRIFLVTLIHCFRTLQRFNSILNSCRVTLDFVVPDKICSLINVAVECRYVSSCVCYGAYPRKTYYFCFHDCKSAPF